MSADRPIRVKRSDGTVVQSRITDKAGAAAYLCTTERHITELVYRRDIPHYHVGQLLRFHLDDLDAYLKNHRTEAAS